MDIQYKSNTFLQDQKLRLLNPELKRNEEHNIKYELIEDIKTTNNLGDVTVYLPNLNICLIFFVIIFTKISFLLII